MKKIYLALVVAAGLGLAGCSGSQKDAQKAEKPQVKLTKVEGQDIPQKETYTATVESDVKNNISPNMQVRIQKVYVEVGDYVRAGQTVVALDNSNLAQMQSQVASQETAVKNQEVQFKSQQAQLKLQETEAGRVAELYRIGGASKSEYDASQTTLEVQRNAVSVQQNAIQQQKNQLAVLRQQLATLMSNTNLASPINGVVTARNYDDGDMYSGTPVLTIEQLNPVKLKINVSETYFSKVTVGMPVAIELDAYPGEEFMGEVEIVYPSMDQNTHTFPVEILVKNEDQKVRPGMFGKASIDMGSEYHVTVPDEALVKQVGAGDRYVYLYRNGKVYYKKVDLGQHIDQSYEILEGVNPGDQVVIAGQSRLADGIEVEVVK